MNQPDLFKGDAPPDPYGWNKTQSLQDARSVYKAKINEGSVCPCCDRFGKRYRRTMNSNIAYALVGFYRSSQPGQWIHTDAVVTWAGGWKNVSDYAKARFWNLLEPRPENDNEKTKSSGYWRLTGAGRHFVEQSHDVACGYFCYNNEFDGFDDSEHVSIIDALGERFDYKELMRRTE